MLNNKATHVVTALILLKMLWLVLLGCSTNILLMCNSASSDKKLALVYGHLPKTGGTEIIGALRIAFGQVYSSYKSQTFQGSKVKEKEKEKEWFLISEFRSVNLVSNRTAHFIIGSIREPCSYYVSAWAYYSLKSPLNNSNPRIHSENIRRHALYYNGTPPYERKEDLQYFEKWMSEIAMSSTQKFSDQDRPIKGLGMLSSRVLQAYKTKDVEFNTNQIDCWVYTHRLHSDLNDCLLMFMKRGGIVPHYDTYLSKVQVKDQKRNPTDHKECSFYYSNTTLVDQVLKADNLTYSAFNMTKCCEFG